MTNFTFSSYNAKLSCTKDFSGLTCEGIVFGEWKRLRFVEGAQVKVKFINKTLSATIIRFTEKNVYLAYGENKIKKVSYFDLVNANYTIETCIRLEKEGFGPYTYKGKISQEFDNWRVRLSEAMYIRREYNMPEHQPSPAVDFYLRDYQHEISNFIFAFKDFKQLFNWFTLSDVQLMLREGFEIKVYQQGIDYAESVYSDKQLALIKDKEAVSKVYPSRAA